MNLRNLIKADAWGSTISAAATLVGAPLLGRWFGISAWIPFGIGIALIPWVLLLMDTVRQPELRRWQVATIAAGNIAWGIATAVVVFGYPDAMTLTGKWVVGVFGLIVLDIGVAQAIGLRTETRALGGRRSVSMLSGSE